MLGTSAGKRSRRPYKLGSYQVLAFRIAAEFITKTIHVHDFISRMKHFLFLVVILTASETIVGLFMVPNPTVYIPTPA